MKNFEVGKTYVFSLPPSWIIGGTVTENDGVHLTLEDCTYMESMNTGYTLLGSVALATTAKELSTIVARAWPLPDGTLLKIDGILIATPCSRDLKPIARAEDAKTIRSTK